MGVNTNIFVIKPLGAKEFNPVQILKGLSIHAIFEQEDLDFETTLGRLWGQSSVAVIAVTIYNEKFIFIDDYMKIDVESIPSFTSGCPAEVLQVVNSDTTDTAEFSFWANGERLRRVSFGLEEYVDYFDKMGITDPKIRSHFEPVDIGAPLEFEKGSSHPMTVLAMYALDFFDFYNLRWAIYQIVQ